jgi:hypothetical protein
VPAAGAATWEHRQPTVQGGEKQSQTGVRHDFRCLGAVATRKPQLEKTLGDREGSMHALLHNSLITPPL